MPGRTSLINKANSFAEKPNVRHKTAVKRMRGAGRSALRKFKRDEGWAAKLMSRQSK